MVMPVMLVDPKSTRLNSGQVFGIYCGPGYVAQMQLDVGWISRWGHILDPVT